MGAYQSIPVTKCESVDSENSRIRYGASSMQGWRRTQEDDLNCCPDFDQDADSMLFAVYDGHGGTEVAEYCAKYLPDFIKQLAEYKNNDIEEALITGFVEFDRLLTSDETIVKLKELTKKPESPVPPSVLRKLVRPPYVEEEDDEELVESEPESAPVDCDEDETAGLLEEACMPIQQVLHRLTNGEVTGPLNPTDLKVEGEKSEQSASSGSSSNAASSGSSSNAASSGSSSNAASSDSASNGEAISEGTSRSEKPGSSGTSTKKTDTGSDSEDSSEEEYNGEADSDGDDSDDEFEEMRASREFALKFTESEDYLELPGSDSGCTACLALIRGNKVYVSNAGDSRCVLSRSGKALDLSVDHKPEDAAEKERIDKAGGFVTQDGRVNGNLNLSRAIGDHNYKRNKKIDLKEQMITSLPDIQTQTLSPSDDFIILACDGIWNSLSSQECVDYVKEKLERGDKISQICEDLFHSVLADNTVDGDGTGCDNMTCIIIDLQKSTRPDPKNHRTSSTGFDHTLSEDLANSNVDEEPPNKKAKNP